MLMLKRAVFATLPATGGLSADPDISDVSTWRWNVSVILQAQRDAEISPASNVESLRAKLFGHDTPEGLPPIWRSLRTPEKLGVLEPVAGQMAWF
jgi:hypothetical protein